MLMVDCIKCTPEEMRQLQFSLIHPSTALSIIREILDGRPSFLYVELN